MGGQPSRPGAASRCGQVCLRPLAHPAPLDRGLADSLEECRSLAGRQPTCARSQKTTWCFITMSDPNAILMESIPGCNNRLDSPLRVTHVVVSLDIGGLERIVVDLIRFGRAQGHDPSVICLERPGTLAAQVETLGIPLLCAGK